MRSFTVPCARGLAPHSVLNVSLSRHVPQRWYPYVFSCVRRFFSGGCPAFGSWEPRERSSCRLRRSMQSVLYGLRYDPVKCFLIRRSPVSTKRCGKPDRKEQLGGCCQRRAKSAKRVCRSFVLLAKTRLHRNLSMNETVHSRHIARSRGECSGFLLSLFLLAVIGFLRSHR